MGVSTFVFESEGLSRSLESLVWLDWLASKCQESPRVCLSGAGIISAHCHTQLLTEMLGVFTSVLMLAHQALYRLSHLPSPQLSVF